MSRKLLARLRAWLRLITPAQSLLVGFAVITVAGSVLLSLPVSSSQGVSQSFLDAFFTASSAVTTTGLVVVDTGTFYSLFGQLVILALFQVGGLGYMVFFVLLAYLAGSRPSVRARLTIGESLAGAQGEGLAEFVKAVFFFTLFFETAGAVALGLCFLPQLPLQQAAYYGVFHSVSAFCTAGFGLSADSFMAYRDSIAVNVTLAVVTFAGGIGFFVLEDARSYLGKLVRAVRPRRLSLHSRLTLVVAAALAVIGSAIIWLAEPFPALTAKQQALAATFQALSASTTTGFNSVDPGTMTGTSLFALILLMFVGASPGGTGGGIKSTTLGVLLASTAASLTGGSEAVFSRRRLAPDTVYRALAITLMAATLVVADTLVLSATEGAPFLTVLFEVVSAFGTVGLSAGLTPALTPAGKVIIAITMIIGRMGPLAMGFALMGRPRPVLFRYAEDSAYVG